MRSIPSYTAADPARLLLALVIALGLGACTAPQDGGDEALDLVTGPLDVAIADVHAACLAACDAELACMGGDSTAAATCASACDARFVDDRFVDTPSARTCLFRERAEMTCFARLDCAAMEAWFAAPDGGSVPCAEADAEAVTACEEYPF